MALTDTPVRGTKSREEPFKMCDWDGIFLLVIPEDESCGVRGLASIEKKS